MIKDDTFNDPKKFRSLPAVANMMNAMEPRAAAKLSKFVNDFTFSCKRTCEIPDPTFRIRVIKAVAEEATKKLADFSIDRKLYSHLCNYVATYKRRIMNAANAEIEKIEHVRHALSIVDIMPKKYQRMKNAVVRVLNYLQIIGKLTPEEIACVRKELENAWKDD